MGESHNKDEINQYYDAINERIKNYMKHFEYKHYEMAQIIGMNESVFYNKISNRNGKFNLLELKKIAEEMFLKVDDLLPVINTEYDF